MSRLRACVRAIVSTWQCFACSTWNDNGAKKCSVCSYDRYGFDTLS